MPATVRRAVPLAALLVAAAAVALVARGGGDGTYTVTAVFENTKGLVPGNDVQAGGADVGTVGDITLGADRLPRVELKLRDGYRLRQGATADLQIFSNAGQLNRFVMVTRGRGPELHDGATIPASQTAEPVELDHLLRTLDGGTRADVRAVLDGLDDATAGRGPDLARALERSTGALPQTAELLEEINSEGAALATLVRDGRVALDALAREPGAAGGFVDSLAGLVTTTARRQADMSASLERLPGGLRSTRLALDRLDRAVPQLRALVRDGRPAVRELTPTARVMRPAFAALRPALSSAQRLTRSAPADLRAVRPLLGSAGRFFRLADPVLCRSNPILDEVRAYAPDINAAIVNFADVFANYDANGHVARIGTVSTDPPRNVIGPDDPGSGSVARPFARFPGTVYPTNQPWRDFEKSFLTNPGERCK